jgi:hypothetical protein
MRSRRTTLVLLALVILLTGAISAANRDSRSTGTTTTTTTSTAAAPAPADAGTDEVVATLPSTKPVRAETGETVVLRVRSDTADIAEILAVGAKTPVGPGLPGELRFVAPTAGDLDVTLEVAGTTAGIVRVSDPKD